MARIARRHIGWGIAALVVTGVAAAVITAPVAGTKHEPVPAGLKLMSTAEGQIRELYVAAGSIVESGSDLVQLDEDAAQQSLVLAQANLQKVVDQARGSSVAVAVPTPNKLGGRIVQTGPLNPAVTAPANPPKKIKPLPQVEGGDGPSMEAPTPNQKLLGQLTSQAQKQISDAKAQVAYYESEIQSIKLELEDAEKAVETSRILTDRARFEADQGRRLLTEGAISQNAANIRDGQLRSQQSMLENNQKTVEEIKQRMASLNVDLANNKKKIEDAEADLKNAPEKATPKASSVQPLVTKPEPGSTRPRIPKPATVIPGPAETSTAPARVEIDKGAKKETDSALKDAEQRVRDAEKAVLARRISAPRKMKIVRWLVKPADRVRIGDAIAIIEYLPELSSSPEKAKEPSTGDIEIMKPPEPPAGAGDDGTQAPGIEGPLQNGPKMPDNTR